VGGELQREERKKNIKRGGKKMSQWHIPGHTQRMATVRCFFLDEGLYVGETEAKQGAGWGK